MNFKTSVPNFYSIDDLKEEESWHETIKISEDMVEKFMALTCDKAPVHVDSSHALKMGYKRSIVHGFLVGNGFSGILGMFLPGSNTVIHKVLLEMISPVYMDDIIEYKVKVSRIIPAVKSVLLELTAVNQGGQLVSKGSATCVFRS
jgi:3-hydroxybutyryl-CoA dehydratase